MLQSWGLKLDQRSKFMKVSIDLKKASRLINPGNLIAVSACDGSRATITPCAWHMPVSKEPPLFAVALAKKHFSSFAIRKSKEFVINIPDWDLVDKMVICAASSGRETNKFEEAELTRVAASALTHAPVVSECLANIECKLVEAKEAGDHYIFVGEAVAAFFEEKYFNGETWNISKMELVHHLGGDKFYRSRDFTEIVR